MRILPHPKSKIPEEELALARSRIAQRLEDLFGDGSAEPAEDPLAADAAPEPVENDEANGAETDMAPESAPAWLGPWPGGPRPPVHVEGADDVAGVDVVGVETESSPAELVGVMARPGEDVDKGGWEQFLAEVIPLTLDAGLRDATSADEATPADEATVEPLALAPAGRSAVRRTTRTKPRSKPVPPAFCPYCALVLQPPPASSRRCTRCRQRIIAKRVEGRAVYLTEAAVMVFDAERQRVASTARLARERERWLRLAASAGAPAERSARLAAAALSSAVVAASRTLYLGTVDRAFRAAKRDHAWETASRLRRDQATALFRQAGSPLPPPADLVALFREGVLAELRGIAEISREAELVGAVCCEVCRADGGRIFRVAGELRTPRLPHEGCPRGLCRCGWDLAARDRAMMRRYLQRRPRTESRAAPNEPAPTA